MANTSILTEDFIRGKATKGKSASLSVQDYSGSTVLSNYGTPIAIREKDTGNVWVGDKKYSTTTSKHQNRIANWGGRKIPHEEFVEKLKKNNADTGGRLGW